MGKKTKRLFLEGTYALLKRWNFDVVAHGLSLHDEDSYYVIRRFDSLAQANKWRMPIMTVTTGGRVRVNESLP
jgi:hypothetical protein